MHLFEASLALYEATGEGRYLARAGELANLFRSRFFDDALGTLREFFGPAWEVAAAFRSERLDPGHMMEWVWLLARYERACGRSFPGIPKALFETALGIGRDKDSGFLLDEVDAEGHSLGAGRRLWPQTEYLKALLMRFEAGESEAGEAAEVLTGRLFGTYLPADMPGRWRDQFALDGNPIAAHIPASSLYHLFAAVAEIDRIARSGASAPAQPLPGRD